MPPNHHTKAELRPYFLAQRKALAPAAVSAWSAQICQRLQAFVPADGGTLHTFLPMAHQQEIDLWPFLKDLWRCRPRVNTCASVADFSTLTMANYFVDAQTQWTTSRWGIPEPTPNTQTPCPTERIEVVLVPLVTFDERGYRVGYGKGFYDRFLAICQPNTVKIGLSFFDPVPEITDVSPNDVRLDYCIGPAKTWRFK